VTIFLQNVTGDEMWVYGYDPECKQQSSQQILPSLVQEACKAEVMFLIGMLHTTSMLRKDRLSLALTLRGVKKM
jgi:hypothetical protein